MEIKIVKEKINLSDLADIAKAGFGDMVKGVVDIEKKIIALGGGLHADEEALLLQNDSKQANLWGVNLYPDKFATKDFVEFDSMINIRPWQNNRSRGVEDENIRQQITEVTLSLVEK